MGIVIPITLIVLGSVLLDVAVRMLVPPAGDDASDSERSVPANPIFWAIGVPVMVVGVVKLIGGVRAVLEAMNLPDPFSEHGSQALNDGTGAVVWGAVILTIGAYIWRGAKRRGVVDRGGRLAIIVGYLLLGVALSQAIEVGTGIFTPPTDPDAIDPGDRALVTFLAWGAPGAAIVRIGTWLAKEKILLTMHFST